MLLVDEDAEKGARCEAILVKLRFAVAPARTVEEAARVMEALRPNLIVARVEDAEGLKRATPTDVPIVALTEANSEGDAMIESIRQALRNKKRS